METAGARAGALAEPRFDDVVAAAVAGAAAAAALAGAAAAAAAPAFAAAEPGFGFGREGFGGRPRPGAIARARAVPEAGYESRACLVSGKQGEGRW